MTSFEFVNTFPQDFRGTPGIPPFPFLDLPPELRLIVYEHLLVKVTHHHGESDLKLVSLSVPGVTMLATCKLINKEAHPVILSKLSAIRNEPVRLITSKLNSNALNFFLTCVSAGISGDSTELRLAGYDSAFTPVVHRTVAPSFDQINIPELHELVQRYRSHYGIGDQDDTIQEVHIAASSYSAAELELFQWTVVRLRALDRMRVGINWDVCVRPWFPVVISPLLHAQARFREELNKVVLNLKARKGFHEAEWDAEWVEGEKHLGSIS
jgi:hypothetical protein